MGRWTRRIRSAVLAGTMTAAALSAWAADGQGSGAPPADARPGGSEGGSQGLSVLSGGVGQEAQDEMRRKAGDYNLHVLFADPQGAYLANVAYSIADAQGKALAAGTSDGPWLYVKLPPGRYQVTAESKGMRQSREVEVGAGKPVRLDFRFTD